MSRCKGNLHRDDNSDGDNDGNDDEDENKLSDTVDNLTRQWNTGGKLEVQTGVNTTRVNMGISTIHTF